LIRATLPKIEGEPPPPRPIPEFTMHQRPVSRRGFGFRPGPPPGPERNGNVAGGGEFRHGRAAQGPNGHRPHRAPNQGNGQGQGSGRRRRRNKQRPR
jgi:hypothetical protein